MAPGKHPSQVNPKRFKLEAVPDNADAVTRAASALDPASDEVPDNLRCPICVEVPLGQVFQCPNGHPICQECQMKSGKLTCSQCRKWMKTVEGDWIRCRVLEDLLDSHWFLCPYTKNGCIVKGLSRADVLIHKKDCFYDGDHFQICQYFKEEDDPEHECAYVTQPSKPEEALQHLERHFHDFTYVDEKEGKWWWFPVEDSDFRIADYVEAAVVRQNGGIFMTVGWNDGGTDQLSFMCLRMDKPVAGQGQPTTVKLTFENQQKNSKIPNMSLTLPITPLEEAEDILERAMKLVSVYRPVLEKKFLDNDSNKLNEGCLKVMIEIL